MSFTSFGMKRGIIRFTSEFRDQRKAFQKLLGTAHIIYGFIALLVGVVIFFLSDHLSNVILQGGLDPKLLLENNKETGIKDIE